MDIIYKVKLGDDNESAGLGSWEWSGMGRTCVGMSGERIDRETKENRWGMSKGRPNLRWKDQI